MTRAIARRHGSADEIQFAARIASLSRRAACSAVLTAALAATSATAQPAQQPQTATAYTSPSEKRVLNFTVPGFLAEVPVKEGDLVKANQLLMRLDDEADSLERDRLKLDAESTARLDFAKAQLDQNQVKLKRVQTMFAGGAGNASEVEDAQLAVIQSEKSIVIAEDEIKQAKIKLLIQEKRVSDMRKLSPIDGIVAKVNIGVGELGEQAKQDGAVVVVKNDPLDVDLKELTTSQVAKLKVGQTLEVRYADDGDETKWTPATISSFAPVADAASETRPIKLKLPNRDGRASGLKLLVKLPAELIEAAAPGGEAAAKSAFRN